VRRDAAKVEALTRLPAKLAAWAEAGATTRARRRAAKGRRRRATVRTAAIEEAV
jgi:hypothetical protein